MCRQFAQRPAAPRWPDRSLPHRQRAALGAELEPYLSGKATLRFPVARPVPLDLVKRVVEIRLAEVEQRDGAPD